jgi:hypothetical protein
MRFLVFLLVSFVLISCKPERFAGFKEESPHLYYQRIALGEGTPYFPNSSFINYTIRFAPFDSINPVKFNKTKVVKFAQTVFFKPESDLLYGLTKGDRLKLILLNQTELFEKLTFEMGSNAINNWLIDLKVDDVVNTNINNEHPEDPNFIEYQRITDYLTYAEREDIFNFTEGVWLNKSMLKASNIIPVMEEITLDYKGYYLDGNTFDIPDYPLKFFRTDQNQVIPGIMIALKYMRPGDSTVVIVPSHLAFGETGSKDGNVPPNEPVVYGLKLLKPGEYIYPI